MKEKSERNVAKTVLQSTKQYLEELGRKMRERSVEAVMELLGREKVQREEGWGLGQFVLLLHALQAARSMELSAVSALPKISRKSHFKVKSEKSVSGYSKSSHREKRKNIKLNGDPKAKTGRKPIPHPCFLCHAVLSYKGELVRHFQVCHELDKSQSVLYKRINQGEEAMRKMYGL